VARILVANIYLTLEAKNMADRYSVVLADAHRGFRREMRKILEEHPDIQVAGVAGNREELFEILAQSQPAMVILCGSMPGLRTREGTRLIKRDYPGIKVLIMVMDQEPEYFSHGLAAGAEGVLPKQYVAGHIFRAIAAVRQGKTYIPPRVFVEAYMTRKSDSRNEFAARGPY
jgi:DNA-binding NarL/FixJ family response regulator